MSYSSEIEAPRMQASSWRLGRHRGLVTAAAAFVALFAVVANLSAVPLGYYDISQMATSGATLAIVTMGQTVVILSGGFDLSAAPVVSLVNVLLASLPPGVVTSPALLMLIGVIVVQQLEGHVLQPFLMGRWVSVHPLAVIVAIATGVLVAGIVGALVAVPLAAALNAVGQHLAAYTDPGDDPVEELEEDYVETGATLDVPEGPGDSGDSEDGAVGG